MAFRLCTSALLMIMIIIFFIFSCSIKPLQASLLDDDQQALLQIKLTLQKLSPNISKFLSDWSNPNSTTNTITNASTNTNTISSNVTGPCSWSRITCSFVSNLTRVTGLDLSSLSISGELNITGFSNLSSLFSLNLSHNILTGFISEDIANCIHLTSLDLSFNNFSSLSSSSSGLSSLSNLQSLNLSSNNISSSLSQAIPINCSSLQFLNLSSNFFMGLSSFTWPHCTSLKTVDLSHNQLTGSLPTNLSLILPSLHHLVISDSKLEGSIPPSLCSNSSFLQYLDVSDNDLTGTFPLFLTNCSSLQYLDLSGNNMTGEISSQTGEFIAIEILNLSENFFTGSIPTELGKLSTLQVFMAGSNSFVGSIPSEITNCRNLSLLDLNTNNLNGNLPDFLSQMPSLQYLVLHSNGYGGPIPSSLFNAPRLKFLDLSNNSFSGSISPQFGNLSSLQFLLLADNQFSGEIPSEIGGLSALVFLDISSNHLQGSIPSSLGQLQDLLWLMLAHNNLTGEIPSQLGNCTSLLWLNLRSNSLTGELPTELIHMGQDPQRIFSINAKSINPPKALGECPMIKRWIPEDYPPYSFLYDILDKSRCKSFWIELLTGSPLSSACWQSPGSGGYIQVTNNFLTGSIPASLQGNQTSMLLLSMNLFIGSLPQGLANLPLRHLNVSHNRLSGPIPSALADNKCLVLLDLSFNGLNGSIPPSLGSLSQLSSFNVSYNPLLSGSIPSSGQFLTFGPSSYMGDTLLCFEMLVGMRGSNTSTGSLPFCNSSSNSTIKEDTSAMSGGTNGLSSKSLWAIGILSFSLVLLCASGMGFFVVRRWALLHGRCYVSQSDMLGYVDKCIVDENLSSSEANSTVYMFERGDLSRCASIKHLTYADIMLATNNFDEANIVGCGGFGIVYKAKLPDGTMVAIKKLVHNGQQGDREFFAEMETLGSIMQENLVPLLGCCVFGAEKLLVYKFLCNGSLEDWLYEKEGGAETLTWARRVRIASNCAKALSYLHHECTPVLIHRDMKASNVLLDEEFNGYVADFGLAREMDEGYTHVSTVVAGTLGYVAPEYCQTWRATTKGDVYSFGVVMLELITGRHPICMFNNNSMNPNEPQNDGNLVEWVRGLLKASKADEAYHPSVKLSAQGHSHQLLKFLQLAQACTLELPEHRPSMQTVARSLVSLLLLQ